MPSASGEAVVGRTVGIEQYLLGFDLNSQQQVVRALEQAGIHELLHQQGWRPRISTSSRT